MPLNMPESVLVKFKGKMQPGITLRDLVMRFLIKLFKRGFSQLRKRGKEIFCQENLENWKGAWKDFKRLETKGFLEI